MLRFLRIRQLAVIDAVEVEFDPGLNVLTGETGAGKSILVEAVGLLLGARASGNLVRTGEDLATIEAIFERGGEEQVIRREITAQGRSRAFIDGELVTAGALKELSGRLIELHGQHEHQTLLDTATHVGVLDIFGRLEPSVEATSTAYQAFQDTSGRLASFRRSLAERGARQELVAFQVAELDRAALKTADEEVELATARQVLASAERIERLCGECYASLYESDQAALSTLGGVWRRVGELASLDPRFQPYLEARDGIKSQLEDLALFLRRYADGIEASPARLQQVEERLALIERLKRKHGPSLQEVIATRERLKRQLADLEAGDDRLATFEQECLETRNRFLTTARVLSAGRARTARDFAQSMVGALTELAMERTRFEVRLNARDEPAWSGQGIDEVEFYLSPNPGEDLRPLARIVSGGELSRIMLAIKTLAAGNRHGFSADDGRPPSAAAPGLIFDEVDAGIGGRVADIVGARLRALGSAFQVLCITHLPQIAAYADTHFQIDKQIVAGRTRTRVTRLDAAARVDEISRMLGGAGITDAIRASAREMLEGRRGTLVPPANRTPSGREAKGESERAKVEAPGSRPRPPKPH